MPTSLVSFTWRTTQGGLLVLLSDILNCPMDHLRSGKMHIIQFLLSHEYKYVLVMVCMLSHWMEAFPYRQTLLWLKSPLGKKLSLPKECFSKLTMIKNTFYGHFLQQAWVVWLVLQDFHCVYHPQSSGLVKCPNGIIKIGKICRGSPTTLTKSIVIGPSKS